jgi:hypothetical protein
VAECLIAILVQAACVFGASAFAKVRSRDAYRQFLAGLSPTSLIAPSRLPLVAAVLAAAELAVASGLAVAALLVMMSSPAARTTSLTSLLAGAALISVLTIGVAVVVRRGVSARCACFGASSGHPIGVAHLIRNTLLLAAGIAGLAISWISGNWQVTAAGAGIAVLVGMVAALPIVRWEDLADLFRTAPRTASTRPRLDVPRS